MLKRALPTFVKYIATNQQINDFRQRRLYMNFSNKFLKTQRDFENKTSHLIIPNIILGQPVLDVLRTAFVNVKALLLLDVSALVANEVSCSICHGDSKFRKKQVLNKLSINKSQKTKRSVLFLLIYSVDNFLKIFSQLK